MEYDEHEGEDDEEGDVVDEESGDENDYDGDDVYLGRLEDLLLKARRRCPLHLHQGGG